MNMRSAIVLAIAVAASGAVLAGGSKVSTAEKIKMLDANADGQVSAAEYVEKSGKTQADFDSIDTDKDGYASAAEMDAHKKMKHDHSSQMDKPVQSSETTPPADTDNRDGG